MDVTYSLRYITAIRSLTPFQTYPSRRSVTFFEYQFIHILITSQVDLTVKEGKLNFCQTDKVGHPL